MNLKTNRTIVVCTSIILMFISAFTFMSCKPRQARVINKLIHDVDHAMEEGPYQDDNSQQAQDARFSIQGVVQYDNGRVVAVTGNSPILIQRPNGLVLGDYIHNSPVYDNDVATITEVYDLPDNSEYEYSFGETATRAYDVEGYSYMCPMSDRTYYFNVARQLQ